MALNKKDIAVIGIGKFGSAVVNQLVELRRSVFAIDDEVANLTQVSRITETAVLDAADIEALKAIGIEQFETIIVSTSNNIEIVAALLELGVKHIIAKANSKRHERVLRQIGVDVVVNPEAEAGIRTALIASNSNFIKYSELLQDVGDGYAIGSTLVINKDWCNKSLKTINFAQHGVSVVSILRQSKISLPAGDFKLIQGDLITLIGKVSNITKIFGVLNHENIPNARKI